MSVELCVLASGSGGNSAAVRTPGGVLLIDLGIGPRTTSTRLEGTGVSLRDIRSVLLTHLDSDHFRPIWIKTLVKHQILIHCHYSLVDRIRNAGESLGLQHEIEELLSPFNRDPFEPSTGLIAHPISFSHDAAGSHGFVLEGFGRRLGYASDLGHIPAHLFEHFCDLDLLALESNYDPQMQMNSARPWFLKRRIMGGAGHLSNQQAFDAIQQILNRCQRADRPLPSHIVLLHRSQQCNCPDLMRGFFSRDRRIASRLTIAQQHDRTPWLGVPTGHFSSGKQLTLSF